MSGAVVELADAQERLEEARRLQHKARVLEFGAAQSISAAGRKSQLASAADARNQAAAILRELGK